MIELIMLIIEAFAGNKRENQNAGVPAPRRHHTDPGSDLEGARPKLDRFGLDHAVPVLVVDVGPDEAVQPAKVRAGEKRRQIEARLIAEAAAKDAAEAVEDREDHMVLPAMVELAPARLAEGDRTAVDPPSVTGDGAKYPYQFQKQAKVTHRVASVPARPVAVIANVDPIMHATHAGRRKRKGSAVGRMLMQPKTLAQLMQAKAVLEPPPSLRSKTW
ncbi:MAG TPA: hypothetical protein VL860_11035 [Planctomycetota bacterium]|nr:hypothetical protein [Planctomycetota bacterium]